MPDEDEDRDDNDFSFSQSLSFLHSPTGNPAGATGAETAGATTCATVAALLGFRPLLPPPPPTAFRFPLPAPAAAAGTGAGVGTGAIAAGLGAIGLNLSMILPICHAAPACCPPAAAPYLGAIQHPPFLSIPNLPPNQSEQLRLASRQSKHLSHPLLPLRSLAPTGKRHDHHRDAGDLRVGWGRSGPL